MLRGCSVGLVLGGGGARGCSHVGMIKVNTFPFPDYILLTLSVSQSILEAGIPIDRVAGVSIGSCMGGLWAQERDISQVTVKVILASHWSIRSILSSYWSGQELQSQDEPEVEDGAGPHLAPLLHDDRVWLQFSDRGDIRGDQHRGPVAALLHHHHRHHRVRHEDPRDRVMLVSH